jgi:hypothetical protein
MGSVFIKANRATFRNGAISGIGRLRNIAVSIEASECRLTGSHRAPRRADEISARLEGAARRSDSPAAWSPARWPPDYLKVFANPVVADEWCKENDSEGVAFEYEVLQ